MPKIRHIGICTDDVHGTADFYIEAFGMIEVDRSDREGPQNTPEESWAVLSDGYINETHFKNSKKIDMEVVIQDYITSGSTQKT
ncbi:MAG: hypothetical protein CM1200mP37_9060 [Chloroflexota bacterium]|nr:MAG: hypothetical protein CM1200mP37_9060 [Chloroflexota bacterium]